MLEDRQSAVCNNSFTVSHQVSPFGTEPNSSTSTGWGGGDGGALLVCLSSSRGGRGHLPSPGELWSIGQSCRSSSSSSTGLAVPLRSGWTGFVFSLLPLSVRFLFGVVASPSVEKSAEAGLRTRDGWSSSLWLYRLGPKNFFPKHQPLKAKVKVAPSCRRLFLEHSAASDSAEPSAVFPLQQNRQEF